MKKKVLWISLASVVFILALVRFFAPGILLKEINSYLAEFSESYLVHVDDFDLSILRGAYRFEKVTVYLKKDGERAQDDYNSTVIKVICPLCTNPVYVPE